MTVQKSFISSFGSQKILCVLLAIVLFGILLRLYCFHGFWGTDDAEYARLAHAMTQGNFIQFVNENYIENFYGPAHLPLRMGLIYPLSILFRLFGINEWVLILFPLLMSIIGILLAYFCGRLLFGVSAGLIAAAIWSILPLDVRCATSFLPDIPASFSSSLGVSVILLFYYSGRKSRLLLFLGGIIAGVLFGFSWLCKESIVYLVPFCLALMLMSLKDNWKMNIQLWIGVAVGSLGILFTEMLIYYNLWGDFLWRLNENQRSFIQTKAYLFYEGSRFGWPEGSSHLKALLKRLFFDGTNKIFLADQLLFLPFVGLIVSAHSLYWKDKSFLIPALWMLTLIFMYNFSSCSFSSYTPLVLYNRYLHPILLPSVLLVSGFIYKLLSRQNENQNIGRSKERFFWGIILAVLIIIMGCYFTFVSIRGMQRVNSIYETRIVSTKVKPSDQIYTDPLTIKALEFYWGYPEKMNVINFEDLKTEEIPPNSFVLTDVTRVNWLKVNVSMWLTKDYGYKKPEFFDHPPKSWKTIWKNANAVLYRVD